MRKTKLIPALRHLQKIVWCWEVTPKAFSLLWIAIRATKNVDMLGTGTCIVSACTWPEIVLCQLRQSSINNTPWESDVFWTKVASSHRWLQYPLNILSIFKPDITTLCFYQETIVVWHWIDTHSLVGPRRHWASILHILKNWGGFITVQMTENILWMHTSVHVYLLHTTRILASKVIVKQLEGTGANGC